MSVSDLKARIDALIKVLGFLSWIPGNSWIGVIVTDLKELETDDAALAVIAEILATNWRNLLAQVISLFQHGVNVGDLLGSAVDHVSQAKASYPRA